MAAWWLLVRTFHQADYQTAVPLFQESLAVQRELGNEQGIAFLLINLGLVAHVIGCFEEGHAMLQEARTVAREAGDAFAGSFTANGRGPLAADGLHHWIDALRTALGEDAFASAWAEGQARTPQQAIAAAAEDIS